MKKIDFWKKKSTRIILTISIFLILVCVIQILRPNREYVFEGSTLFQEGSPVEDYPIYVGLQLPPGVYRIEVACSSSTDMLNYCYAQDDTALTHKALTHGVQVYSGLSAATFHMWLFEKTDALQILINYCGEGSLATGDLHIYETNQLWGIYLTVILFFTALILTFYFLRLYDREYPISRENKNVMFALSVLVLIASIPFLAGSSPSGADLGYHLHRIEGIKEGILAGYFPVRLEPQWVHGHGYANGIFYCGTLLLFPALLRIIGFPVTFSYNCYCIALNIATVLIAYYSFSRIFRDKYIGVVGSALYTLSVFRIFKLVISSAVGEGSAVTFMPLVIYGFWRVFAGDKFGSKLPNTDRCNNTGTARVMRERGKYDKAYRNSWVPLTIGYAGLLQTHVLSCEITAFLTIIVCLVFIKKIFCRETFWELCKGAMGALVLSLWFLVPFLDYYLREDLHIKHVWARTIQERGLYPTQLMFNWWSFGDNYAGVGFILMLGFLVFGLLWFSGRLVNLNPSVRKLGKTAWLLGGLLMLMSLEIFPWDAIQRTGHLAASLVSSLQFPNRFLGWGCAFLVLLCCLCLLYFKERKQKVLYFAGLLCVLAGIFTSGMYLDDHVVRDHFQLLLYNEGGMGYGYISGAEYLVQGTEEDRLLYRAPIVSEGISIEDYEKGALRADFTCENMSGQEGYVDLPLLHYYGYRAYMGEGRETLQVCKGDNNVVRVIIPPGCNAHITAKFVSPWYWRMAEIVSLLGGLGMLWYVCRGKSKSPVSTKRGRGHEKISG